MQALTTCQHPKGRTGGMVASFALLLAACLSGPGRAGDIPADDPEPIVLKRCRLEFARTSTLGTSLAGVLKECSVRPGDRVAAGQLIGKLRDDDVRAEWEFRRVTGEYPVNVQLAEAKKALADTKLIRAKSIQRRGYVSDADLQTAECEARVALLDVDLARQQQQLAIIQARQAEVMIHFREFLSPHGGVVTEIFKTPGESVSPNFPVFRIVDDSRMQVIGQLDVVDAWRVSVGGAVRIWPTIEGAELPIEAERFEGTILQVEGSVDPLTHTCKVVAEVANRSNLLRAGLEATMEIRPRPGQDEAPKAGPAPADTTRPRPNN